MNNTTIGVDPSVNCTSYTSDGPISGCTHSQVTLTTEELEMRKQETTSRIVNDITIPSLRMLLTQVLTTIDVAIPNKDQNRAVKRTIREDFDTAYFGILGRAYPECNYNQCSESRFALDPAPAKEGNNPLG